MSDLEYWPSLELDCVKQENKSVGCSSQQAGPVEEDLEGAEEKVNTLSVTRRGRRQHCQAGRRAPVSVETLQLSGSVLGLLQL